MATSGLHSFLPLLPGGGRRRGRMGWGPGHSVYAHVLDKWELNGLTYLEWWFVVTISLRDSSSLPEGEHCT